MDDDRAAVRRELGHSVGRCWGLRHVDEMLLVQAQEEGMHLPTRDAKLLVHPLAPV